jgi:hypothetical protein
MAVNGLKKGQRFERVVAKLLGQTVCGDDRAFMRMPLMGRSLEQYEGDIIQNPDPFLSDTVKKTAAVFLKTFMLDAKDRKGWSLEAMILSDECPVWEWWSKLCANAGSMGKVPLLVLKYHGKIWAAMSPEHRIKWVGFMNRSVEIASNDRLVLFPWTEMTNFNKHKLEDCNGDKV